MMYRSVRSFVALGVLFVASTGLNSVAHASLVINSAVGGAPTGVNYVNFDNLPLGDTGGTSGGVGVSFVSDGEAVQGSLANKYAAPYLSNSNGVLFGDNTVAGPDTTTYLTTGIGSLTLTLPGKEKYLGLLWGSVDNYNTLSLYDGNTLVGTVTGTDVTAGANGNQGANGTFYVNINSTSAFDRVVASSTQYAFEFDNVSFNRTIPTPEPSTILIGGFGLISGFCVLHRNRRARLTA
jgi:hypothetical protein